MTEQPVQMEQSGPVTTVFLHLPTRRAGPPPAARLRGRRSVHFVLDAVPHWGDWGSRRRFLRVAVTDGLVSLAVAGAFAAASPSARRRSVLAGMAGAALPTWTSRPGCGSASRRFPARSTGSTAASSARPGTAATSRCWPRPPWRPPR